MLKTLVYSLLLIPLLVSAQALKPTKPPRLTLKPGAEITVESYLPGPDLFRLQFNPEPDVGPNYATPEDLRFAIGIEGSVKEFVKKNSHGAGGIYVLKKELPLARLRELKEREEARQAKK